MDTGSLIAVILQTLSAFPYIGPVVVFILNLVIPLMVVVSAFVSLWQGIVIAMHALGALPGMAFMNGIADKLKVEEDVVEGIINKDIIPFVKLLSGIPVPTKVVSRAPLIQ